MRKKLIIFDRDNTLNYDKEGYIHVKTACILFDDVYEFFSSIDTLINICVVTNQSGIGRGYFSVKEMEDFNSEINKLIKQNTNHRGIDHFFFCPHAPLDKCDCRKPKNTLIIKALSYFNCDPSEAILIGDKISDCQAGLSAGVTSILLNRNLENLEAYENSNIIVQNSLNLNSLKKYLY